MKNFKFQVLLVLAILELFSCRAQTKSPDETDANQTPDQSGVAEFTSEEPVGLSSYPASLVERSDIPVQFNLLIEQPSDRQVTADVISVEATSDNQALLTDAQISVTVTESSAENAIAQINVIVAPTPGRYGSGNINISVLDEFENEQLQVIPLTFESPFGNGEDGDVTSTGTIGTSTTSSLGRKFSYIDRIFSAVTNESTTVITLKSTFTDDDEFKVGDEVMWHVSAGRGDCHSFVGTFGFARVTAIDGASSQLTIDRVLEVVPDDNSMPTSSGSDFCQVQLKRVPQLRNLNLSHQLNGGTFNFSSTGGIVVFKVSETLTLNAAADIRAVGVGFKGGDSDHRGMTTTNQGLNNNDRTANGMGGGANKESSNSEGGGGGSMVAAGGGGVTGDDGRGGEAFVCTENPCTLAERAVFGGGGGGGADADGEGGDGGGIVLVYAKNVVSLTGATLNAGGNDGKVLSGGTINDGGGGAGGVVGLFVDTIDPSTTGLLLQAVGGDRGQGTAGGGAGGHTFLSWCDDNPDNGNVTASVVGGLGNGTTNNGNPGLASRVPSDLLCQK